MESVNNRTFKQANHLRMERWSDSVSMKRYLKRARHKAQRRDNKTLTGEE